MKPLLFSAVAVCFSLLLGCSAIPVARTYSISYGEAKASVHFDPPPKRADPKLMREPVTSIDLRREKVVLPPVPEMRPLIVTRFP